MVVGRGGKEEKGGKKENGGEGGDRMNQQLPDTSAAWELPAGLCKDIRIFRDNIKLIRPSPLTLTYTRKHCSSWGLLLNAELT